MQTPRQPTQPEASAPEEESDGPTALWCAVARRHHRLGGTPASVTPYGDRMVDEFAHPLVPYRLPTGMGVIAGTPEFGIGSRLAMGRQLFRSGALCCLVAWFLTPVHGVSPGSEQVGTAPPETAEPMPPDKWSNARLRNLAAWPHSEADVRLAVTADGLRVEVAAGRKFAIAAASQLALPADVGSIRVRVAEIGGEATWFIRLYGELRRAGDFRTAAIAQDETAVGPRLFQLDPRLRQLPDSRLQLQLGVEGPPGAYVVFEEVALLPAVARPNRSPRTFVQSGQLDIAAVELMPNLPEPYALIDWREKARAFDRFVFDESAQGEFLPLVWLDNSRINIDRATFGLPSYVGAPTRDPVGRIRRKA